MTDLNDAFWRWFGKSTVVDRHGMPREVYHGTNEDFDTFRVGPAGGIYFATEESDAHRYADLQAGYGGHPIVVAAFLRIERDAWPLIESGRLGHLSTKEMNERLLRDGYDGYCEPGGMCVVFSPNQIKSVENDGTWDKDDPDIRSNPMEYEEVEDVLLSPNPRAPAVSGYEGMQVEYVPSTKLIGAAPFGAPDDALKFAKKNGLLDEVRERFYTVYLNQSNTPLGYRLISAGGPSATLVDPVIVFGPATALAASSVIFIHNHPGGSPKFSQSDLLLTEKLIYDAKMLGIRVLDHMLIVPAGDAISMREEHPDLPWVTAQEPTIIHSKHNPMEENPPWADKMLSKNWDAISNRLKSDGHGLEWMPAMNEAHGKMTPMNELGCGHYGCVYTTMAGDGLVSKITTDVTEATFVAIVNKLRAEGWEPPQGIVRYHAIYALPEKHRNRQAYILWREEAKLVGWDQIETNLLEKRGADFRPTLNKADALITAFKTVAHEYFVDASARSKKLDIDQYYAGIADQKALLQDGYDVFGDQWQRLVDRYGYAPGLSGYEQRLGWLADVKRFYGGFRDGGVKKGGWYLFVCEQLAQEMVNSDVCYVVGQALQEFMEKDLLLADVHLSNVGTVERPDENDFSPEMPVIIDPGHIVSLSPAYADVQIEMV